MASDSFTSFEEFLLGLSRIYHRLSAVSDQLHAQFGLTAGTRSILLLLHYRGQLTLSEIARDRAVSRQFIQRIAAPLIVKGIVATVANPANRRSSKLELTEDGKAVVALILRREEPIREAIKKAIATDEITIALNVLTKLDAAVQSYMKA